MENSKPSQDNQEVMPVSFTVFKSTSGALSKRYSLDDAGDIAKTPAAQMTTGTAKSMKMDFSDFAKALTAVDASTVFGYGMFDAEHGGEVEITVAGKENPSKHVLSRTQKFFKYREQPGGLMIDHDPDRRGQSVTPGQLRAILTGILPDFGRAASWCRGSVSAGVHREGEQPQPGKGFHHYNPVLDASDIPRFGAVLFKRLWLAGYGFIDISAAGTFLVRFIIDAAVFSPERLDFVGAPIVGTGLVWTPPEPVYLEGGYLDTRQLSNLSGDEERQFEALVETAKVKAEPERAKARAAWLERQVPRMVERGASEAKARKELCRIATDGATFDLHEDFSIDFARLGTVSVSDVLADPTKFDGQACADPFEGTEYGTTTAKFYPNRDTGKPCINSQAHGGVKYFLSDASDPDPVPFDDLRTPTIPCDLLPGWAGAYAAAVSEAIQVPPELVISNVLGVVSVCAAKKFEVEIKPGYREPLNIWPLCPLDPGERKSGTQAACIKPIIDWEVSRAAELEPEIKEAKSKAKTFEKIIEHQRAKAAKAKTQEDRYTILEDIRELEKDIPAVPTIPRLLADDITPEAAAPLMQENGERLGIMSAEGGIFDLLAGRYSNGIPNLDLFLKAHSGDSARIDRKNGVPVILHSPALTMCLSPQPEVVRGLASKPGFRGRGLLGRFLYFMPASMLGRRRIDVKSLPENVRMTYDSSIESLLNHPWEQDLYGQPAPHLLRLSSASFDAWREFSAAVEVELRDDGKFYSIRDWAGKLPGAAARLAGLFHILKHAGGTIPPAIEIESMNTALQMATLLTAHAHAAFGVMGADPEIETAKHILEWIKRYRHETFTARDCHRALQGRYRKMSELSPGFEILIERAFIQPIVGDATKSTAGRPSSTQYRVNPKAYA